MLFLAYDKDFISFFKNFSKIKSFNEVKTNKKIFDLAFYWKNSVLWDSCGENNLDYVYSKKDIVIYFGKIDINWKNKLEVKHFLNCCNNLPFTFIFNDQDYYQHCKRKEFEYIYGGLLKKLDKYVYYLLPNQIYYLCNFTFYNYFSQFDYSKMFGRFVFQNTLKHCNRKVDIVFLKNSLYSLANIEVDFAKVCYNNDMLYVNEVKNNKTYSSKTMLAAYYSDDYHYFISLANKEGEEFIPFKMGVAKCYNYGKGVEINHDLAYLWYKKAAEYNDHMAYFNLYSHLSKYGNDKFNNDKLLYLHKAANLGNDCAALKLGWMYANGINVTQNNQLSFSYYKMAADMGNAEAINSLGVSYYLGRGVEQNYINAFKCFTTAKKMFNKNALSNIAESYRYGYGVMQNNKKAIKYYKKAIEAGCVESEKDFNEYLKLLEAKS